MDKESGWQDHLHFGLYGEHVLIDGLHLDSAWPFFLAACLTVAICVSERILTYALAKQWTPFSRRPSRLGTALWRTCLYWLVTFDRLLYMLIGMTFSLWLILIAVTTLAAGQFVIEYSDLAPRSVHGDDTENIKEPLLDSPSTDHFASDSACSYPPRMGRPRAKSKPENIFIHPNHSNLARADAAAVQMGISGDTERVKANVYPEDEDAWEHGRGRDVARELLLGRQ